MQSQAKELYDTLKEEGVLKQMYGKKMTGVWKRDKTIFTAAYIENEALLNNTLIEEDTDEQPWL